MNDLRVWSSDPYDIEDAIAICGRCCELTRCQQWLASLQPRQHPTECVVAGNISASLTFATWVLSAVTAALLVATIVLAAATFEEKQRHEQPARQATEEVANQER